MTYRLVVKNTIIMETISGVTSEANILTLFMYHKPGGSGVGGCSNRILLKSITVNYPIFI